MITSLLMLSVFLSTLRNILSKNISDINFGTRVFFLIQTIIFGTGGIFLAFTNAHSGRIKASLLLCSVVYGILLIIAQYCYTIALKSGKTGICATVYSLGFIFPTLSGSVLWDEQISAWDILGICIVIVMIIICGSGGKNTDEKTNKKYIFPLVMAMLASGGLGIAQKFQQNSDFNGQNSIFLIIAFAFACAVSFILYLITPNGSTAKKFKKKFGVASFIGIAFAISNLCNTTLSGMLDSAILFPALNIGTIILSVLFGIVIYKERITKSDALILSLGIISICLLNI